MKKVFAYIGSGYGENSKTLKLLDNIMNNVKNLNREEYTIDIYTPKNSNIKHCISCNKCFKFGKCSIEKNEDMKIIKEKMLEADLIILGSPVYAHNVSGDMKVFLDRISYWMHTMPLAGKIGIILVTSGGNGINYVNNYLYKVMSYLGISVVDSIAFPVYDIKYLQSGDFKSKEINDIAINIGDYLFNRKKVQSNDVLEKIFKYMQKEMLDIAKIDIDNKGEEYNYWLNNGYLDAKNFQSIIDKKIMK